MKEDVSECPNSIKVTKGGYWQLGEELSSLTDESLTHCPKQTETAPTKSDSPQWGEHNLAGVWRSCKGSRGRKGWNCYSSITIKNMLIINSSWAIVVHTFNPSTQETEAGETLVNWKSAWSTKDSQGYIDKPCFKIKKEKFKLLLAGWWWYSPSTQEAVAGESPWVQGQAELQKQFLDSQVHTRDPAWKTQKKTWVVKHHRTGRSAVKMSSFWIGHGHCTPGFAELWLTAKTCIISSLLKFQHGQGVHMTPALAKKLLLADRCWEAQDCPHLSYRFHMWLKGERWSWEGRTWWLLVGEMSSKG